MKAAINAVLYFPMYNILIFLAWVIPGHSIGWAIVVLTILIRLALLPASLKAAKAQARLQLLQPEINKIKAEIKDQQAQGKAMMELYKKEGVSPFGSCLPLLIQLPIIFVLYRVFQAGLNTSGFIHLYSFVPHPDTINTLFFGLDLAKPELWVLPILAGVTQFILSKMMTPPAPQNTGKPGEPDPMQMMNKQMIYIFPLVTVFIARSLPAALGIYWVVTTIFGIVQQIYVNKSIKNNPTARKEAFADAKEIEAEYIDEKKTPAPKKDGKRDMIQKIMSKRLDKQEKKAGVEVTIRKKQ